MEPDQGRSSPCSGVLVAFSGNILALILGIAMVVFGTNQLAMVIRH